MSMACKISSRFPLAIARSSTTIFFSSKATVWLLVLLFVSCLLTSCFCFACLIDFCFAGGTMGASKLYNFSVSIMTCSLGSTLAGSLGSATNGSLYSATNGDGILLGLGVLEGVTTSKSKPLRNKNDDQSLPNLWSSYKTNKFIKT